MDKVRLSSSSRVVLSMLIIAVVLLVSGCETTRGLVKDSQVAWDWLKQADDWMQENLW